MIDYKEFLEELVKANDFEDCTYKVLLDVLYRKEFHPVLPMDIDRAESAKSMRRLYLDMEEDDLGVCRCIEVLIDLSRFMAFQLRTNEETIDLSVIFWELLDNLGLTKYTDEVCDAVSVVDQIGETLENWMYRNYDEAGNGNIFPLKNPKHNQKNVEIWYQMHAYILEKTAQM